MNEEVEIKVELKNPEEVEKKLNEVAEFVNAKEQVDEYFTPKHEDFFDLDVPLEYLRVRHEDGKNEFGYHFLHLGDGKVLNKTDEYEVSIDNPEMMSIILKKLDMVHKVTVSKHRKTFNYLNFEIVLDYIEELGHYLEVEVRENSGSFEDMGKKCYAVLDEIGANWKDIPLGLRGYPIMVLAKRGKL